MAIKKYTTNPRVPELEPHHQIAVYYQVQNSIEKEKFFFWLEYNYLVPSRVKSQSSIQVKVTILNADYLSKQTFFPL